MNRLADVVTELERSPHGPGLTEWTATFRAAIADQAAEIQTWIDEAPPNTAGLDLLAQIIRVRESRVSS